MNRLRNVNARRVPLVDSSWLLEPSPASFSLIRTPSESIRPRCKPPPAHLFFGGILITLGDALELCLGHVLPAIALITLGLFCFPFSKTLLPVICTMSEGAAAQDAIPPTVEMDTRFGGFSQARAFIKAIFANRDTSDPISEQTGFTKTFNDSTRLWIQREDCNSGLAFGGNKVRELEYVLADAVAQGADTLELLGADVFPVRTSEEIVLERLRRQEYKPYSIPTGASTHPFGGLGYALWAFELLEQESKLGVSFDIVVLAVGSGSTLGGLVAGFNLAHKLGLQGAYKKLVAFSIRSPDEGEPAELILGIVRTTASKIGLSPDEITRDGFELDFSYLGEAYGQLDERTADGIRELAMLEGILPDPVYTGKAFTGLLHTDRSGALSGKNVQFCHTGGQAALGAYPQLK
ncbi:hypothetical protein ACJZ2D_000299 [Fusarium nematophilum]